MALSRLLKGESAGDYWNEVVMEASDNGQEIIWKEQPHTAKKWADKFINNYITNVGKYLDVINTEEELLLDIPGVDIPILGYVDVVTTRGVIDIKTTGYVNRKPELNPEWKLQMHIYQLKHPKDGEFHVITRNATSPIVVPSSMGHPFYVEVSDPDSTKRLIRDTWKVMNYYYEEWGDKHEWPGNFTHPWANKYCPLGDRCCHYV